MTKRWEMGDNLRVDLSITIRWIDLLGRTCIGVDLAGILRGTHGERRRWVGAECGGVWWGCPLFSRLGGLGSAIVSSPSGVRGRAPAENGFWRILKATERSFLYLYDKNLRGTICTSVPPTQILGGTCPRVSPVIYAHGQKMYYWSFKRDVTGESCEIDWHVYEVVQKVDH